MELSLIYEPRKGYQSHCVAQANGRAQEGALAREFQVRHPLSMLNTVTDCIPVFADGLNSAMLGSRSLLRLGSMKAAKTTRI